MMKINKETEILKKESSLGIYIHIPFCLKKCHYCDFYSEAGMEEALQQSYVEALKKEVAFYGDRCKDQLVDTIFIGGGTPTILKAEWMEELLTALKSHFHVAEDAEISMECNPATLTEHKLSVYRRAGINRLSIGVQSMDDQLLKTLGRVHGKDDVVRTVELTRKAGFDNLNLDVMFGVPEQNMEIWKNTVKDVLALKPEHLSFYSLELAEDTAFYHMFAKGQLQETAPELDRAMYHHLLEKLKEEGYEHYEISNGSLPGKACRHNLKYWNLDDYLGLGASAHSYFKGYRFSNVSNVSKYIASMNGEHVLEELLVGEAERPAFIAETADWIQKNTKEEDISDFMFTALRKLDGIRYTDFERRFQVKFKEFFASRMEELSPFVEAGDVLETEEGLKITPKGMDIANQIIAIFVGL